LNTVAELEYMRDRIYPFTLQLLYRTEVAYSVFSGRSDENARIAKHDLFSVQNSRKAREGGLSSPSGLLDPALFAKKRQDEKKLREAAAADPKLKEAADAWDKIAAAQKVLGENSLRYNMLEGGRGFNCQFFSIGRTLLRAAEERPKPNGERLREFRDSNLEALKARLTSKEPIYPDFEIARLAGSLTFLADELGANNEIVKKVLAGKSPQTRAAELVQGTKLKDAETREKLYEGGKAAVDAAKDPMIELARLIDEDSRAVRKTVEAQAEIKQQAYAQIGKVKYAVEGASTYPDATFTLRLSFGPVKGYKENGKDVPPMTTIAGLYERSKDHHNKEPFDIPERWLKAKDKLDLKTPFNFVSTADIIGGNSGSPVINKDAELVGIIFDGNIQSLVLDFAYSDDVARAVSVHSAAIIEALRKVYEADDLANELTGKKQTKR
jgi:nicotinamide mononucleotide adenylyltransferase